MMMIIIIIIIIIIIMIIIIIIIIIIMMTCYTLASANYLAPDIHPFRRLSKTSLVPAR